MPEERIKEIADNADMIITSFYINRRAVSN